MKALALAVSAALLLTSPIPQTRPLPDLEPFLREVRKHIQRDEERQSGYSYVETRRERKLDNSGKSTRESVKVFENYPGLPGEERWNRLISEDGRPVPAEELARGDREREKKAQEYVRRLTKDPNGVRQEEARERDKKQRETQKRLDDALVVFDIRLVAREQIQGHETIALSLTPRPQSTPATRVGRIMKNFSARAWVSESDYEITRVDIEAIDNVSIGLGLLARVYRGTRASFARRKVNDEIWLPASASYTATARIALFKMMRIGGTSEFSAYRKFTVGTATTFATPQ